MEPGAVLFVRNCLANFPASARGLRVLPTRPPHEEGDYSQRI
jgi:hypothetical protein